MSKHTKEICKLLRADKNAVHNIHSAFGSAENLFSTFKYNKEFTDIEIVHNALLHGIEDSLIALESNTTSNSPEIKDAKVKYLIILKEKIEKSKELLTFL